MEKSAILTKIILCAVVCSMLFVGALASSVFAETFFFDDSVGLFTIDADGRFDCAGYDLNEVTIWCSIDGDPFPITSGDSVRPHQDGSYSLEFEAFSKESVDSFSHWKGTIRLENGIVSVKASSAYSGWEPNDMTPGVWILAFAAIIMIAVILFVVCPVIVVVVVKAKKKKTKAKASDPAKSEDAPCNSPRAK